MTEHVVPKFVEYKLNRRAATNERSYFVVSFVKPLHCSPKDFVKISCLAFHEIMSLNHLEHFALGDPHVECNNGTEFSAEDVRWREKFEDDTFVPGRTLFDIVLKDYKNQDLISFSFYGQRGEVEKFFDPEGDYSSAEADPEWYCEGRYSGE